MWVSVNGQNSVEIDDSVIKRILNLYPEEKLINRKIFQQAFSAGSITFKNLKEESEKILIPWQMFFLSTTNLNQTINHIETQRQHKVSKKIVAKRKGQGKITPKRIVDRLIRQQNYLVSTGIFPSNSFCGSLKYESIKSAADKILDHFDIDRDWMWRDRGKEATLEALIKKVGNKNINVSQGTLAHKILPNTRVVPSSVYKNTSGFAIKDDHVPFIFLPSETNQDEVASRQIYTLFYLLTIIGLDQYEFILEPNFTIKITGTTIKEVRLHLITSELLIPRSETEKIRGTKVTESRRDELANKFKVSPTALLVTLRRRGVISSSEFDSLKPKPIKLKNTGHPRTPKVSTSVSKFCGLKSFETINLGIKGGTLPNTQAQHLIWGAPQKKGFLKYRSELSL